MIEDKENTNKIRQKKGALPTHWGANWKDVTARKVPHNLSKEELATSAKEEAVQHLAQVKELLPEATEEMITKHIENMIGYKEQKECLHIFYNFYDGEWCSAKYKNVCRICDMVLSIET